MTVREQVDVIVTALGLWAKERGGTVHVAEGVARVIELLGARPGAVRVIVWPKGGSKRGEYEEAGMEDRTYQVIVSRGKSAGLERSASVAKGTAETPALWDLVEEVRDVMRGLSFSTETTEVTLDYRGWEPLDLGPEAPLIDAYALTFSLGTQLPAVIE